MSGPTLPYRPHAPSADGNQSLFDLIEQLTERLNRQEPIELDDVIAQHPEHAEELRKVWPTLAILAELRSAHGSAPSFPPDSSVNAGALTGTLGDFRILKEIGRGGMGVVYEAEQISLGRHVALKVLPFAGVLDERQLQRFKNEALAAAHLNHPHIVDVYGVGCERGVHFYTMRLIDGVSIQQLIEELRTTPARGAGEGSGDASAAPTAETPRLAALSTNPSRRREYYRNIAQLGIDAAEALHHAHEQGVIHRDIKPSNLMLDGRGKLWVTDFGLAQIETGATLTMSGELIGTLRYMSPEQASGQRLGLDHRCDVYSLGATLYELLTLQPAFTGENRAELLQQILLQEPKPMRKVRPEIPVDLETIVLKAMAKLPSERYRIAGELAADLRRFADGQSIKARKPTVLQLAGRWIRRHAAIVVTVSVVVAIASIISTILIASNHSELVLARNRADEKARVSRQVVDRFYTQIAESWLLERPELTEVQLEFLDAARTFYEEVAREGSSDKELLSETANTMYRIGTIHELCAQFREAEVAQLRAIELYGELVDVEPTSFEYQDGLAEAYYMLARAYSESAQLDRAIGAYSEAIKVWEALAVSHPESLDSLSSMAHSLSLVAGTHRELGELEKAEQELNSAISIFRDLINRDTHNTHHRFLFGIACTNCAMLMVDRGDVGGAEELFRESITLKESHFESNPDEREASFQLAFSHQMLAETILLPARIAEAMVHLDEALTLYHSLVEKYGTVPRYYRLYCGALINRANLEIEADNPQRAIARYRDAVRISPIESDRPEIDELNARIRCNLGQALLRVGEYHDGWNELQMGHALAATVPTWPYPSARWVEEAENLVRLDSLLNSALSGNPPELEPAETLELAQFCLVQRKDVVLTAQLFRDAFEREPALAKRHRYNAACAAALAATSSPVGMLNDAERAAWREQALEWLAADLRDVPRRERDPVSYLGFWLEDPDLSGVRDPEGLALLSDSERVAWETLWNEVRASAVSPLEGGMRRTPLSQ